jgi:hypothetical protein
MVKHSMVVGSDDCLLNAGTHATGYRHKSDVAQWRG